MSIERCVIYDTKVGLRAEDGIERHKVKRLGFEPKVGGKYHMVAGGVGKGYRNEGEFKAPDIAEVVRKGL